MVYLIDLGTCYKIGITNNLKKRIEIFKNSRETVVPIDIIVYPYNTIDIEKIDKNMENELHILCKKYKISRELFQKVPEVVEIFKTYKIKEIEDLIDWKSQFEELLNSPKKSGKSNNKIIDEVFQYDLDGNFIKKWNSVPEIEKELKFLHKGIYNAICGIYKTSYGYIWSKKELSKEELLNKILEAKQSNIRTKYSKYNKILQYTKDGVLVNEFKSITEASNYTNISISSISLCCSGRYKTAGNFIWKKGS